MGRLPGSWDPPAWGGPWKGLMLAASVLGSCLQPAPAQTSVTITPKSPVVGEDVSLAPQPPPENLLSCSWYRSATTDENSRILTYYPQTPPVQNNGPAHTGRETAGPGCALNIAGLTLSDTGNYTVAIQSNTNRVLHISLRVYEKLAKPTVTPGQTQVPENGTLTLTCNTSPRADTVLWLQNGSYLTPNTRLELSSENRTLTVLNFTWGDTGTYQCEVGNPVSTERSEPSTVTLASKVSAADSNGGLTPGAIAGIVIGSLAAVALLGVLLYFLLRKSGRGPKQRPPVEGQAAPTPNLGVCDNKPTLGDEDIQYSTLAFTAGDQKPPPGPEPPRESGTVYSEIRKK